MYKSDDDLLETGKFLKNKIQKRIQNRLYLKINDDTFDNSSRNNELTTKSNTKNTILPGMSNSTRGSNTYTSRLNTLTNNNISLNKNYLPLNQLIYNKEEIEQEKREFKKISDKNLLNKNRNLNLDNIQIQVQSKFPLSAKSTTINQNNQNNLNNLNKFPSPKATSSKATHSYADPYKKFFKTQIEFQNKTEKEKMSYIYRNGISLEELKKFSMQALMTTHNDENQKLRIKKKNEDLVKKPKRKGPKRINLEDNYKPVVEYTKKIYQNHAQNLGNQVEIRFRDQFQLIKTGEFSDKYKLCTELADTEEIIEREKRKDARMRYLEGNFKLNEDVNFEIKKQMMGLKLEKKLEVTRRWKRVVMSSACHFNKLNISLQEFYDKKYLSLRPYETDGSRQLIQAIKEGNSEIVKKILSENKLLVHGFDYFNQTPLHWAAKRDQYHIIPILLRLGSKIDAEDYSGRTALHVASQNNSIDSIKILLYELAYPFKLTHAGELAMDLTKNKLIRFYLERAKNLHIINRIDNARISGERIRHGFKFFFDFGDNSILKELVMEREGGNNK